MIHKAKNVESMVSLMLNDIEVDSESKLYNISKKVYDNILSVLDAGVDVVINKPKVLKSTYGGKVEPKSDLVVITTSGKHYKFSIKTELDKAYIHTSNSYADTMKMFTGLSFSKYLSNDEITLIDSICSKYLKKVSRFDEWDSKRGTSSDYVDYQLSKNEDSYIKWIGLERFLEIKNGIKNEYLKLQESGETPYKDFLHIAEPEVQKMLGTILKNKEYAKHLIFEMLTGNEKFGKNSEASANYVVASDGVWELSSANCKLVEYKLDKFISRGLSVGRLQNVPRVGLSKKIVLNENLDTIIKSFPTADMSMKL